MSYEYISETWPAATSSKSQANFLSTYSEELKKRVREGPRFFFFLMNRKVNEVIGLANIYLDYPEPKFTRLQIAEFYLISKERGKGNGKKFFSLITKWGIQKGAKQIRIEVDKNLIKANQFWSKLELKFDPSGNRNVYFKNLASC